MSDSDKPEVPSTPAQPAQPATQPSQPASQPAERKPERFVRQGRQQTPNTGRVPSLESEQTYGFGKKIDAFDAEMERELQEAMSGFSDKDLLTEAGKGKTQEPAGPKKGRVFRVHGADVFIDLPGGRSQGVLPVEQFPEGPPEVGTEVDVEIEGFDRANGLLLLTRKGAAVVVDWSSVAEGQTVEARVTGTNKGGLAVEVNGIRGFIPISQIELFRVENVEAYVNQKLLCVVTEVDPLEHNLVLSRRALLEKDREEQKTKLWAELEENQVREGIVRSVRDFGAFVDLGGVDGLLHVSEMSWTRVQDPSAVVQPGQKVKVIVLRLDREHHKVSLGMKQLMSSPWDTILERYIPGTVVSGKVTRTADFGAFVELEPGIEGLIHVSELSPQRVWRVTDAVKVGDQVQVKVLNVDTGSRRISLSLKGALPTPEAKPEEEPEDDTSEPAPPPRPRNPNLRGGLK
jgi:small subunit ribosomal protein S1